MPVEPVPPVGQDSGPINKEIPVSKTQTVSDIITAPTRLPAIITELVGDGEGGWLIRASCPFVGILGTNFGWNGRLTIDENHAAAALAILVRIGYSNDRRLIMGRLTDGKCAFVQVPAGMVVS
jgi:hypothetical protein